MTRTLRSVLLTVAVLLLAVSATCQAHSVTLNWTASADAAGNPTLTYNVYRAAAACPTDGTQPAGMAKVANVSAVTYQDTAVSVGQSYCYAITALLNGSESAYSNTAGGTIPVAPPGTITIVVK